MLLRSSLMCRREGLLERMRPADEEGGGSGLQEEPTSAKGTEDTPPPPHSHKHVRNKVLLTFYKSKLKFYTFIYLLTN